MIQIQVQSASLTRDTDFLDRMDPYVILNYGGQQYRTTQRVEGGRNPRWGETFTFQRSGDSIIRVQVWDKDTFTQDDLIGEGQINIGMYANNMMNSMTSQTIPLTYKGRSAGSLSIGLMVSGGMGTMGNPMGGMGMGMGMPMGGMQMGGMGMPMGGMQMGGMGMPMGGMGMPMGGMGTGGMPMGGMGGQWGYQPYGNNPYGNNNGW